METHMVKLAFESPVHFGGGRLSGSECSCDAATLFSALFIEALNSGGADELLAAAKSGALTLSDAFPYIGDRPYIPKPMVVPARQDARNADRDDSRARKANKALKYIPADEISSFLNGSFDFIKELGRFDIGASFLRTKVNLTRSTSDEAEPYHVGGYRFAPGCGIYFLFDGSYDLLPLLEQLSYSGLGGKRSSGYGRFTFEVCENPFRVSINNLNSSGRLMLLTSALPHEEELDDCLLDGARYHLVRKSGFVQSANHSASPQKKRSLWTFAPGSVFRNHFEGDVFDVNATPGAHPVYRYARAMWMEI